MPNELDSFLGDLKEVQEDPFKKEEGADPFAKKEEKEEEVLPFNKDPKIQRYIQKEIAKATQGLQPREIVREVEKKEDTTDSLVDVLTRIIGNDTPEKISAVKDFRRELDGLTTKAKREAIEELQQSKQEEVEAEREASAQLDESFEAIEERFGVDITSNKPESRKVRSEFVDFVKRISPKNQDGEVTEFPDLVEAFDVFKSTQKTAQPNRAKELASRGMSKSSDTSNTPSTTDNSWKSVERMISKLTN